MQSNQTRPDGDVNFWQHVSSEFPKVSKSRQWIHLANYRGYWLFAIITNQFIIFIDWLSDLLAKKEEEKKDEQEEAEQEAEEEKEEEEEEEQEEELTSAGIPRSVSGVELSEARGEAASGRLVFLHLGAKSTRRCYARLDHRQKSHH